MLFLEKLTITNLVNKLHTST